MISIPFRGSKIYSYNSQIKPIVIDGGYNTVLEPFGGSAVLSVNLKRDKIVKTAVINDYDHLWEIYPEFLDIKDWLVSELLARGVRMTCHSARKGEGRKKYRIEDDGTKTEVTSELLQGTDRETLQSLISTIDKKWWHLLSLGSCFTFDGVSSENEVKLYHFKYFRGRLRTKKDREYLKAVKECEVMSLDWREFLEINKKHFNEKTIIILDPPYTGAKPGIYKSDHVYTLDDMRNIVGTVAKTGCDFILFNYDMEDIKAVIMEFGLNLMRIEYTGTSGNTVSRRSRDVLAYVQQTNKPKQIGFFK